MKKITFLAAALFSIATVFAQTSAPIEFKETKFAFGKIKQGVPATHIFTFKNVSDKPVVIESAVAGCGCTTPEYPKGVIAKGGSEKISVTYNAASMGAFTKQVTVRVANVTDPIILNIEGEVTTDAAPAAAGEEVKAKEAKEEHKEMNDQAKVKDTKMSAKTAKSKSTKTKSKG